MGAAFLLNFLRFVLIALQIAVLGRVLLSWVEPSGRSSISQFLTTLTEPILGPIRKVLPASGGFDLSPLILLLVIGAVVRTLP